MHIAYCIGYASRTSSWRGQCSTQWTQTTSWRGQWPAEEGGTEQEAEVEEGDTELEEGELQLAEEGELAVFSYPALSTPGKISSQGRILQAIAPGVDKGWIRD